MRLSLIPMTSLSFAMWFYSCLRSGQYKRVFIELRLGRLCACLLAGLCLLERAVQLFDSVGT